MPLGHRVRYSLHIVVVVSLHFGRRPATREGGRKGRQSEWRRHQRRIQRRRGRRKRYHHLLAVMRGFPLACLRLELCRIMGAGTLLDVIGVLGYKELHTSSTSQIFRLWIQSTRSLCRLYAAADVSGYDSKIPGIGVGSSLLLIAKTCFPNPTR